MAKAPEPAKPNQPQVKIQQPQQQAAPSTPFGGRMAAPGGNRGVMAEQLLQDSDNSQKQPWQM